MSVYDASFLIFPFYLLLPFIKSLIICFIGNLIICIMDGLLFDGLEVISSVSLYLFNFSQLLLVNILQSLSWMFPWHVPSKLSAAVKFFTTYLADMFLFLNHVLFLKVLNDILGLLHFLLKCQKHLLLLKTHSLYVRF